MFCAVSFPVAGSLRARRIFGEYGCACCGSSRRCSWKSASPPLILGPLMTVGLRWRDYFRGARNCTPASANTIGQTSTFNCRACPRQSSDPDRSTASSGRSSGELKRYSRADGAGGGSKRRMPQRACSARLHPVSARSFRLSVDLFLKHERRFAEPEHRDDGGTRWCAALCGSVLVHEVCKATAGPVSAGAKTLPGAGWRRSLRAAERAQMCNMRRCFACLSDGRTRPLPMRGAHGFRTSADYSYGLYLWRLSAAADPLHLFPTTGHRSTGIVFTLATAGVLAALSWRFRRKAGAGIANGVGLFSRFHIRQRAATTVFAALSGDFTGRRAPG